jgi:hypothetical protein
MTIDERLDRLTERHDALRQTVEQMIHQRREWWEKNQVVMTNMLERVNRLARIAQAHERRIMDAEGGRLLVPV